VPAHVVSRGGDLARDPHLRAANHFREIDDPSFGEAEIEGPRFQLHRTPHVKICRGPLIGEHTDEVLHTVCKLSDQEIAELKSAGVLA
jgi:crotonobetainyl-CoA:carnitine CoA-transferase CaiB-like acyl-CoA transferase